MYCWYYKHFSSLKCTNNAPYLLTTLCYHFVPSFALYYIVRFFLNLSLICATFIVHVYQNWPLQPLHHFTVVGSTTPKWHKWFLTFSQVDLYNIKSWRELTLQLEIKGCSLCMVNTGTMFSRQNPFSMHCLYATLVCQQLTIGMAIPCRLPMFPLECSTYWHRNAGMEPQCTTVEMVTILLSTVTWKWGYNRYNNTHIILHY